MRRGRRRRVFRFFFKCFGRWERDLVFQHFWKYGIFFFFDF